MSPGDADNLRLMADHDALRDHISRPLDATVRSGYGNKARPEHEAESLRLGGIVCEVLRQHGVTVEWDGTLARRIAIAPFEWRKRRELSP